MATRSNTIFAWKCKGNCLFDQLDQFMHFCGMDTHVSLYDAKTRLSSLVDRAAAGEEIVISKNGVPYAKLVAVPFRGLPRQPANASGATYIADDFNAGDTEIAAMFGGASILWAGV